MSLYKQSVLTILALLLSAVIALGQGTTGSISGEVHDPNGAVIPNAKVTAHNVDTGIDTVLSTNEVGIYVFPSLVPGNYQLTVETAGFRKLSTAPFRLSVSDNVRMNLTLEIGQITETVTVETNASALGTEDAQLGRTLTNIAGLPILSGNGGRNALSLMSLQPGVTMQSNVTGVGGQVGPFTVNGQRAQANNYLLDGGDSNDLAINIPDSVDRISPNALAEFRLVTGPMKAEFGRNSGAVVEVMTKSGANAFHGGAQEVFRNTKLNASPFFQNSTPGGTADKFASGLPRRPQFNLNDFDANGGGRIIRDRTFFFASYLGFRRRQGVANSGVVFTDAERAAILSQGVPAAQNIVKLVPQANAPGGVLLTSPSNALTRDQGLLKMDHKINDHNYLSGTYFIEHQTAIDPFPFGGTTIPGFGTVGTARFQNVVLRETYTMRSNLVNDAHASFHRRASPSVIPLNKNTPNSLGFSGIVPDDAAAAGPVAIRITGLAEIGNTIQGPQSRFDNTWQFSDNLSWIRGRHSLKFGADFRAYEQNQLFDFVNNGLLTIDGTGTQTGAVKRKIPGLSDPLNDFANGFASTVDQSSSERQGYRDKFFSAFAQDDWKLRPNFTLNLGLRWEYDAPLTELNDQVAAFRPGQKSTVFPDAPPGIVYPGDAGISRSTYKRDFHSFAPRIGFAWDPFRNGKISIRAGYGIFYDAPVSELSLQFLGVPPYGIEPEVTTVLDFTKPYATSQDNPIPQPFPFVPVKKGGHFDYTSIAPVGLTVMNPNFTTPYGQQWTAQVQYQLANDWLADVAYVGSNGVHLLNRRQINYGVVTPTANTANINPRRIYNLGNPLNAAFGGAVFGGITDQTSDGKSNYNSLQAGLTKRFAKGFFMSHAYTWSHTIDNSSGLRVNTNPFNNRLDRGNSEFDARHRYVGSLAYDLPFMRDQKGFAGHLLGGWGVSTVVTLQSGFPIQITESTDRCLCGAGTGNGGSQRPDYIGGSVQFYDPRNVSIVTGRPNSYFDGTGGGSGSGAPNPFFRRVGTAGNAASGAGRFGTLGRNVFHGPGILNDDLSISKTTRISEHQAVEFRAGAFNLFNHTQFNNPSGNIGSTLFGRVTTTRDPRLIQLSLHYTF